MAMKKFAIFISACIMVVLAAMPAFCVNNGTIKLAHTQKENDLFEDHYKACTVVFKNVVERDTNGRFKVQVYPNGQLGDNRSELEQCQKGLIQMTTAQDISMLALWEPEFNLYAIPYVFRDELAIQKTFESPVGQAMVTKLAKEKGIRLLGIIPVGFRCFSNNKRPITSPTDMKGLKMRVMEIPLYVKMTEALGASATPVAWAELYTACQTGTVDGQENAPNTMLLASLQEVQKYYTLDNHTATIVVFCMNEKYWQSLSPEDKKTIMRATKIACNAFTGVVDAKETRDMDTLRKKMKVTVLTPQQRDAFKKACLPASIEYLNKELGADKVKKFLKQVEAIDKQLY